MHGANVVILHDDGVCRNAGERVELGRFGNDNLPLEDTLASGQRQP